MEGLQLLVLYVTVEQENAVRTLFDNQNWKLENKAYDLYESMKNGTARIESSEEITVIKLENADEPSEEIKVIRIVGRSGTNVRRDMGSKQKHLERKGSKSRHLRKGMKGSPTEQTENAVDTPEVSDENLEEADEVNEELPTRITRSQKTETDDQVISGKAVHNEVAAKEVFKCSLCGYSSTIKSNYLRHSREVHVKTRHSCSLCNKSFKSGHEAKLHELHAHAKLLKCKECDKTFTSRGGLLNHNKQVHLKKTLYNCEICQSTFIYKQHYQGHMNSHNAERPFSCGRCEKPFCYKSSMVIHEKNCNGVNYLETHNEDGSLKSLIKQKYLCDMCGDTLSNKSSLKMHRKLVHTEMPKSVCPTCGKQFKSAHSLTRHIRIIHTEDTNARLPCEICGRTFNQVTVLRQHVKRHKQEFSVYCGTCGKGFYSNYKMKEHERIHTGEKPYSCPVCVSFTCSSKNNLLKHMRVHENTKKARQRKKPIAASKGKKCAEVVVSNQSSLPSTDDKASMIKLETVAQEPLYKTAGSYAQVIVHNGEIVSQDDPGNHDNMGDMAMTNELGRYNYGQQYGEESVILVQDNGYDSRMHNDGYYGNMNMSTPSDQMPQGLNILTVAMNMVNPGSY